MNLKLLALVLMVLPLIPIFLVTEVVAQETIPDPELPIEFSAAHAVVVLLGVFGGLTTAYLGYRKARKAKPDEKFNITKFGDRVIIAVLASIGLAIGAAVAVTELNIVTMYMIFMASIGTSEFVLQIRSRG